MFRFFSIKIYWRIVRWLLLILNSELGWGSRRILVLWNYILLFSRWRFETTSAAKVFINIINLNYYFAYLLDFMIMMHGILFFKGWSCHFFLFLLFFFTFIITWREINVVFLKVVRLLKLLSCLNSHSSHIFVKAYCWWGIGNHIIIWGRDIVFVIFFDVICWSLLKCPCHCTIPIG